MTPLASPGVAGFARTIPKWKRSVHPQPAPDESVVPKACEIQLGSPARRRGLTALRNRRPATARNTRSPSCEPTDPRMNQPHNSTAL